MSFGVLRKVDVDQMFVHGTGGVADLDHSAIFCDNFSLDMKCAPEMVHSWPCDHVTYAGVEIGQSLADLG